MGTQTWKVAKFGLPESRENFLSDVESLRVGVDIEVERVNDDGVKIRVPVKFERAILSLIHSYGGQVVLGLG